MGAASKTINLAAETCRTIQCKTKPASKFPVGLKAAAGIPTHAAVVLCKSPSPAGAPAELLLVSVLGGGTGAQPASLQSGVALTNIQLILAQATMLGLQCQLSSLKGQLAIEQSENQLLRNDLARANNIALEYEGLRAKQDLASGIHQKSQVSSLAEVALGSPQHSSSAHWDAGHALGDQVPSPNTVPERGSPASARNMPAGGVGPAATTELSKGQVTAPSRDQQTTRAAREAYPAIRVKMTLQSPAWARHSTESEVVATTPRGSRIPNAPASPHSTTAATSQASRQAPGSCAPIVGHSTAAGSASAAVSKAPNAGRMVASSSATRNKGPAAVSANPGRVAKNGRSSPVRRTTATSKPGSAGALGFLSGVGMQPKEGPSATKEGQQQAPHRMASSDVDLVGPLAVLSDESTGWLLAGDTLDAWQRTPSLVLR